MKPEEENNWINLVMTVGLKWLRILQDIKAILFIERNREKLHLGEEQLGWRKSKSPISGVVWRGQKEVELRSK